MGLHEKAAQFDHLSLHLPDEDALLRLRDRLKSHGCEVTDVVAHGTTAVDSGLPHVGRIFAISPDGDLRWYSYLGHGEADRSGSLGWQPNSGNPIGRGWQDFLHVLGFGTVLYAVALNGDLLWYRYDGNGEQDLTGAAGWRPNSGNPIGNGW
jgi:hypothetical protein